MPIKKVTLASLILFSLVGCSSSGSNSNNVETKSPPSVQEPSKPNNNNKAQKSEAERLKKEEADRLAKEQADAERLKKEEADRLAKEQADAERLKKEEADRLAKEQAEAERLKKEEADRLAKEQAEAERLKKEETDRLAKETAFEQKLKAVNVPAEDIKKIREQHFDDKERERFLFAAKRMKELGVEYNYMLASNYADNSLETNHKTSLEELLRAERAYLLGVEGEKARKFAESYSFYSEKETKEEIDNRLINFLKEVSENQYNSGLTKTANELIYNQKYSITIMPKNDAYIDYVDDEILTKGLETATNLIPNEGRATYTGKAYGAFNSNGELSYSVDFSKRIGNGKITGTGLFKDNLILEQGSIEGNRIISTTKTGDQEIDKRYLVLNRYELKFFGPKAEEIGGKAFFGAYTFGLVGSRGEIAK